MAINIARYETNGVVSWGVLVGERLYRLPSDFGSTTAEVIGRRDEIKAFAAAAGQHVAGEDLTAVRLLSPITTPCRIYCQGLNYRSHLIDSGLNPDDRSFNTFFTKSSASVTGPRDPIVRPKHVKLLDYELELGLVIGKQVTAETVLADQDLAEVVAGVVIGNDVSARDVQLPQVQFFKGKSYRSFCPLGPYLCLLERREFHYLDKLQLHLQVNGETRQNDTTDSMIYKPAETLSELTQFADLHVGDVVLTGTPAGTAIRAPSSKLLLLAGKLMPEAMKWKVFIKKQLDVPSYLQPGDVVSARIASADGQIDLGEQINPVMA